MQHNFLPNPHLRPYTYRIDNLVTGEWYWGVKKPKEWPDGYMGTPCAKIPGTNKVRMLEDIKKYGIENFEKTVLEFFNTYKEAERAEKELIRPDLNDPMCYNAHCGGKYATGEKHPSWKMKHTEEARHKMRLAQQGRTASEETRHKIRMSLQGKPKSEEHRFKIGEGRRGHHQPDEAKRKIGEVARNRPLVSCIHCRKVTDTSNYVR